MSALSYVILRHEGFEADHFDLMFESEPGGPLVTWRSGVWPLEDRAPLERLGDHRRQYLQYEGPISGNRGHVRRVACGTFEWLSQGRLVTLIRFIEPALGTWLLGAEPDGRTVAIRA